MLWRNAGRIALIMIALGAGPAYADNPPGWSGSAQGVTADLPFVTVTNQSALSNERALGIGTASLLQLNDGGANGTLGINYSGTALPLANGGTGATAQQGAVNAILNFSGLTSQDIVYYNGTNWVRAAKGADGTFWGVSGGNVGYYTPSGGGTVTSFSAGDLSPLFTTSEATVTTTPALSFALSNATAYQVFGEHNGVTGPPSFGALTANHIPNLDAGKITSGALAKARQHASTVYNDATNTYSGTTTQDFSASGTTLTLPTKSIGTTASEICVDSGNLKFYSTTAKTVVVDTRTISAGTGLTGGGDLSDNRTISLDTPVSPTNGGSGANLSGAAAGAIPYSSGSGVMTTLSPSGAALKYLQMNSGATAPQWATISAALFGGDGSAGAVTKGTVGETITQINATTFVNTNGTTYTPDSGVQINCTSTCQVSGTITVGNLGNGVTACAIGLVGGGQNAGSTGGTGGDASGTSASGGGGGGFGGAGGAGGDRNGGTANAGGRGGKAVPVGDTGGGGGAGGSESDGGSQGGGGGGRGGKFVVCAAGAISVDASDSITANGAAGSAGTTNGGGGGGGAGGFIMLASQTSVTLGSGSVCTVTGGAGAAAGGANSGVGGGGGGGRWISFAPTVTHTTAPTAGGGAAGSGTGITTNAAAGSSGVVTSITGTPNLPILASLERNLELLIADNGWQRSTVETNYANITAWELAPQLAAYDAPNDIAKYLALTATYLDPNMTPDSMTAQDIGDVVDFPAQS